MVLKMDYSADAGPSAQTMEVLDLDYFSNWKRTISVYPEVQKGRLVFFFFHVELSFVCALKCTKMKILELVIPVYSQICKTAFTIFIQ